MKDTIKEKILAQYPHWHSKPFLFTCEEMDNPYQVYKEFFDAYSLPNIRVCLRNWLYSACHDENPEALNLLTLYRHCERLIEASWLVYENRNQQESPKDAMINTMETFFGIFSHEIRNQIGGIIQCCEIPPQGKDTGFYLQAINTAGYQALNVLDNLLATVKYHAGKLDIRAEKYPFRLGALVKTIMQPFEAIASRQEKIFALPCIRLYRI